MLEDTWRPRAELDLQSIVIFLGVECRNKKAAIDARKKLDAAIELLREFPDMGGRIRLDSIEREYRTMPVDPYIIYYTYDDQTITVHRILHQRQDMCTYALVDLD